MVSLYAHLSEVAVSVGDFVSQGQVIGKSGNSGSRTTGAHLHFELRKNETCRFDGNFSPKTLGACTIDPQPYFGATVVAPPPGTLTTSGPQKIPSGGMYFSADAEDITLNMSTASDQSNKLITDYLASNPSDIIINTNFSDGSGRTDGLVGGNGNVDYRKLGSLDYAMLFHNNDLDTWPQSLKDRIENAKNDQYAIMDISTTIQFPPFTAEELDFLRNNLKGSVSGLAKLVDNGSPMTNISDYRSFSEFTSRTVIGWKGSELVVAVIENANLSSLVNIVDTELNLDYAISLDGGGSSQMYFSQGFGADVGQPGDLLLDNKVYWPATNRSESGPRRVPHFLGIKLKNPIDSGTSSGGNSTDPLQCVTPVGGAGSSGIVGGRGDVPVGKVFTPGILSCSLEINSTGDYVDFDKLATSEYLDVYIQRYNLDTNQSYTWVANRDNKERPNLKQQLIAKLGDAGDASDRAQRIEVTNFLMSRAVELGINPRFAFTLWLEESGGSAMGGHALGCGVNFLPSIPYGQGKEANIRHLGEQLNCLRGVLDKTGNFNQYMCTFSGEPATDGTATECEPPIDISEFGTIQPNGVRNCNIDKFICNPNFPAKICEIYDLL